MRKAGILAAGFAAGCVAGVFGGGGGMVLVPLLTAFGDLPEEGVFPASLSIMLPICITALLLSRGGAWQAGLPWLPGSLLGGILAGIWGQKIPVIWLHRLLGLLILWGGIRYLC